MPIRSTAKNGHASVGDAMQRRTPFCSTTIIDLSKTTRKRQPNEHAHSALRFVWACHPKPPNASLSVRSNDPEPISAGAVADEVPSFEHRPNGALPFHPA